MKTAEVAKVLAKVYDPELTIDIVSLGLVYGIELGDDRVTVTMTTTSPACPMSDALQGMAEAVLAHAFPGKPVGVVLKYDPQWSVEMADREALEELGLVKRR